MPPRVEYRLTDRGVALLGVIESMREFGLIWLTETTIAP
jgi:DNA-binding HxlR family transcriptional regulator